MKQITSKLIIAAFLLLISNVNLFAQINFGATPGQGCAPVSVTFGYTVSNSSAYRVEWNFNDGSPMLLDTLPLFTSPRIFSNPGNYNVSMNVFSSSNSFLGTVYCSNSITVNGISINSPDTLCVNDMAGFCANGANGPVVWNFGDGTPTSDQNCTNHAYSSVGTKTVSLTGTNGQCGTQTVTKTVYVTTTAKPYPNAWTINNNSCPGVPIAFNTNTYISYSWNFGDPNSGPNNTSALQSPQHNYSTTGNFTATLTVVNGCGKSGTTTRMVNISANPPFPNYPEFKLQNPPFTCPNSNVNFNAPHGYNIYKWHFGDGSPVVTTSQNWVNHTYGGTLTTYNDSVTIVSACGNDTTLVSTIQVTNNAPFPNGLVLNTSSPSCPNSNVNFNAPGGYPSYKWNFGDNSPVITTNDGYTNHFYGATPGTYNVSVIITSACGNSTTLTNTVVISSTAPFPSPGPMFRLNAQSPSCPNDKVGFEAPGGYPIYKWNFGDGSPVVTTNDNRTYHIYGSTITTYTASVIITNGCGATTTLTTTVQIKNNAGFPNYPDFRLNVNSPSCPNSNVGFQAPGGYSIYKWHFGDSSPDVTSNNNNYNHAYGSTITSYAASVKITNGCGHDTTLYAAVQIMNNVGFPNDQWFKVESGPNPACPTDLVNFNAPNGYSNYKWKFGDGDSVYSSQNNAHHAYTVAATYTYSVKITNACGKDTTLFGTVVVGSTGSFYSGLSIETNPNSGSCPGDLVSFRVNPGSFHSYSWNFGDNSPVITTNGGDVQHAFVNLGTYNVSCKVKNGCGDSTYIYAAVQVINNSPISGDLEVASIQNPSCPNDKVFFVIKHGQSKYIWNYGDGSPADTTIGVGSSHIYSTVGSKTVTVIATNACGSTRTITMTQTVSTTVFPTLIGQDGKPTFGYPGSEGNNGGTAGCAGDAIVFYFMGSAANNVWNFGDGSTGTATEHMVVDGGDGAFPVTIIKHVFAANGTYNVSLTITNNCGNSVTESMVVNIGGNQIVNGDMTTSPPPFTTCASINFIAFGGSSYKWNFGDGNPPIITTSPTVTHTFATQGSYTVTVLVTNGCGNTATYSKSVNVTGAGGPAITLSSSAMPTCVGGNNGSATITVANGQLPYTYLWNTTPVQTTTTASNLHAGMYYAKVTDNIGCASTLAVTISNPAPIVLATSSTPSACGSTTGTATVGVTSGGTSPFTYLWSNGGVTTSATGLPFGLYSVTVTDVNGCTSSSNVSISETNAATVTLNSFTNAVCNGNANGALSINVTGGASPLTYLWSNGANTQNLSNIAAGVYSLVVTDNNGCKATFNGTVGQPNSLSVITTTVHAPTCGNQDGSASASVTGGTSPYTYLWSSGTNSTTATVSGLPVGADTVTVTDANGCSATQAISLSNSNAPVVTEVLTDVSCFGLSNGAINTTVVGGTSPYTYTWSTGTSQPDLTGLISGNYLLFVEDAVHCKSVRIYTVAQPALLTASVTNTGATCNNSDGNALAMPLGGNTPFTYSWNTTPVQTSQTAVGLAVGSYTVTVTDTLGCTATAATSIVQITQKPSICMVTVDDLSINNIIYWDKTPYVSVDSFIVYRAVSTAIYKRIGAVAYDSLSEFVDTSRSVVPANGNPNVGPYRYKIQIRDLCGNYGAMSHYHNTIYIDGPSPNGNFDWNLPYTIENEDPNVANYRLLCDTTLNTILWFEVGAVDGTQANVADAEYQTHKNNPNVQWRVQTDWTTTCEPTRALINTTRSNIKKPGINIGVLPVTGADMAFTIYPNPAKEMVTIELPALAKNVQLKIINVLGQTVFNETVVASSGKTTKQINTTNFAKGVYSVVVETNTSKLLKKLVVN